MEWKCLISLSPKSRYFLLSSFPLISKPPIPTTFPTIPIPRNPTSNFLYSKCSNSNFTCSSYFRSFSKSSQFSSKKQALFNNSYVAEHTHGAHINRDKLLEIVELIKLGKDDMELKLNDMNLKDSLALVSEIVCLLNDCGTSAWHFFDFVRKSCPGLNFGSRIYNQMIDNLGRVGDYGFMLLLLRELSSKRHCLTETAFGFLRICGFDNVLLTDSVERVMHTLNAAGGSCRSSGIHVLIKMLCSLNTFDLAIFVMQETARKTSYYNILISAKCRSGKFHEARDLFAEMKSFGCDPNISSYNYLLGSLCKKERIAEACELLEVMENLGYLPNPITFEIVAFHACRLGRIDFAKNLLYQMMFEGLKPRITTHAAFIKGYFWSWRAQDAYSYVVDMITKDKRSGNMNCSLLASLYHKSGRVIEARDILVDMIEKGLKPNFSVYMRVMKDLYKLGQKDLVADLKCRFSKFS